jgi:hypothetical protein
MPRIVKLAPFLAFLAQVGWATCTPGTNGTTTPRAGLYQPAINECSWGASTNNDWGIVDSSFALQGATNTFTTTNVFKGGGATFYGFLNLTDNNGLHPITVENSGQVNATLLLQTNTNAGAESVSGQNAPNIFSAGSLDIGPTFGDRLNNVINVSPPISIFESPVYIGTWTILGTSEFVVVGSTTNAYSLLLGTSPIISGSNYQLAVSTKGTVSISSNTILPGATFYQGAPTQITQVNSPFFGNAAGQSIYGNFVGSATITTGSSVTVTLNGSYTHYVIRVDLANATGVISTAFLRFNNDGATNYGFSSSGFYEGTSTGTTCGAAAANGIALTAVGATGLANTIVSANTNFFLSSTLSLDVHPRTNVNGVTVYQNNNSNPVLMTVGGEYASGSITSVQAWIGTSASCSSQTDPLTGTTGTMEVWGVF